MSVSRVHTSRMLNRRSGLCIRCSPLLVSHDSLRSLSPSAICPLGNRFLRSPSPSLTFPRYVLMKVTIVENTDVAARMKKAVERLRRTRVEVGLPEDASARNRWLLALHERGSPMMRIPPRPVVGPALAQGETQAAIADGLRSACEAAFDGDEAGIDAGFEEAGQAGVQGIHDYIDAGIEPGNAQVTISGGWIYNRVVQKGVKVPGKGFDKPMYDTGELYNSFSFEVKVK